MKNKVFENVSILIVGYDPYVDVWNHYFELLNKYWTNRPVTYLATNELQPIYDNVKVIKAGKSAEWSKKVQVALKEIETEYIILLLEDFFTTRMVDNEKLHNLIQIMSLNQIKYCKLSNRKVKKGKSFKNQKHQFIIDSDKYGVSLQPSIWKTDYLKERVGTENYNAWIFEFNQNNEPTWNQNRNIDCIYDNQNVLEITHGIVQSKYLRKCIYEFKKQGYEFDLSTRSVFTREENFKYRLKQFANRYSPTCLRGFLKKIGKLLKVDFVSDRILGGK